MAHITISDTSVPVKELPFDPKSFLDAVGEASKRTRSILLVMTFASALIFMAGINALPISLNWLNSKAELYKNISKFIIFPDKNDDFSYYYLGGKTEIRPVGTMKLFIILNEGMIQKSISKNQIQDIDSISRKVRNVRYFMLSNPKLNPIYGESFSIRLEKYSKIISAINFVIDHQIYTKEILNDYIKKLDEAEVEHISLVRVPILGVSFHINYLGLYSGFTLTIFYLLLLLALNREHINMKMAFRRGWTDIKHHHYYFYEYAAMQQVLSVPVKLFNRKRWDSIIYNIIAVLALFFPLTAYLFVFCSDWLTFDIGNESNSLLTFIIFIFNCIFLSFIVFLFILVVIRWIKMDKLWSNQALEFNFEYILECLKIDETVDLLSFNTEQPVDENDIDKVKNNWYYYVAKFQKKRLFTKSPIAFFEKFINSVFKKNFDKIKNKEKYDKVEVDAYWDALHNWYLKYGKKNVESSFRKTFKDMLVSTQENLLKLKNKTKE